jgi:Flp pilus assembly protein TadD
MTIHLTPTISDDQIAAMDVFDAFRLGEELLESRYPRDAARVLRRVVEDSPDNASAWELLARAHFAAAQLRPAENAFRRLIELEPTSGWAHTALGLTLDRQSRHREGAVLHRVAAAMGESPRDASRVQLVDRPVV